MQIPIRQPKRPSLELCSIRLYSTGLKKIYTKHFYRSMNKNFGVEVNIQNNTYRTQEIKIGGCIYDSHENIVSRWGETRRIGANDFKQFAFFVKDDVFSRMKDGRYKILLWINDKRVHDEYFMVSYK